MNTTRRSAAILAALAVALTTACKKSEPQLVETSPPPARGTLPWKVANARSAAPPEISAAATVFDWKANDTATAERLIAGDNGWICYPDDPQTEGNDPICIDEQGQRWFEAWQSHRAPQLTGMAIAYALQGAESASDTDPFKTQPDSGQSWIVDAPYIAIAMPNARSYAGLPTTRRTDGPWVKFARTPYAFIVIPAAR